MEVFRDIEGYEGYYQATSLGKIWSVPRVTTQGKKVGGYYLKYSNTNKRHYNRVELRKDGCDKLFKEAAIETKTNYPSLIECLHGKNKTAGGYVWKFVN